MQAAAETAIFLRKQMYGNVLHVPPLPILALCPTDPTLPTGFPPSDPSTSLVPPGLTLTLRGSGGHLGEGGQLAILWELISAGEGAWWQPLQAHPMRLLLCLHTL